MYERTHACTNDTHTHTHTRARARFTEVVAHWRLIHDIRDDAVELGAEFIVLCDVGKATRREDSDESTRAVARARHVVQRSAVSLVPERWCSRVVCVCVCVCARVCV
jgi:hypothetical protein